MNHVASPSSRPRINVVVCTADPLASGYCPLQYLERVDTAQGSMSSSDRDSSPVDDIPRLARPALAAVVDDVRTCQAGTEIARLVLAACRAEALRRTEKTRRRRPGEIVRRGNGL